MLHFIQKLVKEQYFLGLLWDLRLEFFSALTAKGLLWWLNLKPDPQSILIIVIDIGPI